MWGTGRCPRGLEGQANLLAVRSEVLNQAVWAQVWGGGKATVNADSVNAGGATDSVPVRGRQRGSGSSGRPACQREDHVAPELSGLSVAGAVPEMWSR